MKLESGELGVSFEIPDRPSVRQQLTYWSRASYADRGDLYFRYWDAALSLIDARSWQCERLALDANLDELEDADLVPLIQFVGLATFAHVNGLKQLPKN